MRKVACINRFSDLSIAFMVLGLTGLISGTVMLYSGISCYLYNLSIGFGATSLIIDAVAHGLTIALNGTILMVLCLFSLFPIISKFKVDFIWGLSIVSLIFAVSDAIGDLFMGVDPFSVMVSLFSIMMCAIIFYLVNYTKKKMDARIGMDSDRDVDVLKKVC